MATSKAQTAVQASGSELVAQRYLVHGVLGRGGAGEVYRVLDTASGRTLALKRLAAPQSDPKRAQLAALFEREYHTLAELAHPHVIAVYDYGLDDGRPYYTMECLDGHDLYELAPLPWRQGCALLRDVAAALGAIHARRLVHRDLSPRNVRCTADGRAKLIDFGALAPMGPTRQIAGTPGYMAPEVAHSQELDGRADLYSLGAVAYYVLTGRHAFPARDRNQLADAWRTRPVPPSALASEVPRELDALVMSLLSADALGRPAGAAEVIGRLEAIAGLAHDQSVELAQAALTAPMLVGRGEQLALVRDRLQRALLGEGGSLLISGAPGMGKSRLLASGALEAKLAGACVVRAQAGAEGAEPSALVRGLATQLMEVAGDAARSAAQERGALVARALVPAGDGEAEARRAVELDGAVRNALLDWFADVACVRPLCVLVDDLHAADPSGAAFLSQLCARASGHSLLVIVAADAGAQGPIARLIAQLGEAGGYASLAALSEQDTAALLRSVFGDACDLKAAAPWVHRLSAGNPGSCMQLARHLVDRGIARFADGAWTLPAALDDRALPASFEQALEASVARLSECARALAQLLSLATPHAPLGLADYPAILADEYGRKQVFAAQAELERAELVVAAGDGRALRDRTLRAVVERSLSEPRRRALHRLLAEHYDRQGGIEVIVVYHLWQAGDLEAVFRRGSAMHASVGDLSTRNAHFGRTPAGIALIETICRLGEARGISPAEQYRLRYPLMQLASVCDPTRGGHCLIVLEQLRKDSGQIYWRDHPELPPLARLQRCYERAQAVHDATPEHARGLPPLDAIRELAVAVSISAALFARTFDTAALAILPALIEPFTPLSPVVEMLHGMVCMTVDSLVHGRRVLEQRDRWLTRLEQPIDGLDELVRQGALCLLNFYAGLGEAMLAHRDALRRADALDRYANYAALAWQVRRIYHLNAGDLHEAERCRRQCELLALQHVDGDAHLTRSLIDELQIGLRSSDLLAVKRLLPRFQQEAEQFAGWRAWHAFARAGYDRLRGEPASALATLERCLSQLPEPGHPVLQPALALRIELLVDLGRSGQALAAAREALARLGALELLADQLPLSMAIARAEAAAGRHAQAAARVETHIAELARSGVAGVPRALLHECRARVALAARDMPAFERHAALAIACMEEKPRHPMRARIQQLVADALSADHDVSHELVRAIDAGALGTTRVASANRSVVTLFASCTDGGQRAQAALELLASEARSSGGYLFGVRGQALSLLARNGLPVPDAALVEAANRALKAAELDAADDHTSIEPVDMPAQSKTVAAMQERSPFRPFVLRCAEPGRARAFGVVLLDARDGSAPQLPFALLTAVCQGLLRAGDVGPDAGTGPRSKR